MDLYRVWALGLGVLLHSCVSPINSIEECADYFDETLLETYIDPEANRSSGLPEGTLNVDPNLRVLTINIGNMSTAEVDSAYNYRIAYREYEDRLAARFQSLDPKPQIVSVQEVLSPIACDTIDADSRNSRPDLTCFPDPEAPIERILGSDYQVVCDGVAAVDCLAVLKTFGSIEGANADLTLDWAGTAALPPSPEEFGEFDLCDFAAGECFHLADVCDRESSVSGATIRLSTGEQIRAVWVHPTARGKRCQEAQMIQAFRLTEGDWDGVIMLGDWNYDPWVRQIGNSALDAIFDTFVSPSSSTPMHLHGAIDDSCNMIKTGPSDLATLDFVVSDFAHGWCRAYKDEASRFVDPTPLGRFDEGILESFLSDPSLPRYDDYRRRRMDHAAVMCDLYSPILDRP
jgi:hypothetical protein